MTESPRVEGGEAPRLTPKQQAYARESTLVEREARLMAGRSRKIRFEDLVSTGNEALVRAAARFDPTREIPFDGYAYTSVHFAMQKEIDKANRLERAEKLTRARLAGYEFLEEQRDESDVFSDSEADKVRQVEELRDGLMASLFAGYVGALVRAEGEEAALERVDSRRALLALRRALDALPNHRSVVELRYFEDQDWDTTAAKLRISVATARRHHDEALRRLGARLRADGIATAPTIEDR